MVKFRERIDLIGRCVIGAVCFRYQSRTGKDIVCAADLKASVFLRDTGADQYVSDGR